MEELSLIYLSGMDFIGSLALIMIILIVLDIIKMRRDRD